jgi:hypothetical protein
MPDVGREIQRFRQAVLDFGRNADEVEITLVIMSNPTADALKRYRDMGITRVNIGVGMDNWDKPNLVMPMIDKFSKVISEIAD